MYSLMCPIIWSRGAYIMNRVVTMQAGYDAPALLWNTAVRTAVKGGADPDVVDDIVEDMLLAGGSMCTRNGLAYK